MGFDACSSGELTGKAVAAWQALPQLPALPTDLKSGMPEAVLDACACVKHHTGGLPDELCQLPHLLLQLLRGVRPVG